MTYRIISTFDGEVTNCSLSELSRNLKLNTVLCELNTDGSLIDSWPLVHETLVTFAVEFADYALLNYAQKKIPEAEDCISLIRKWLENHDSVSNEELTAAAYATDRAANAADAADAANAAYAAEWAAYAATHAANAATAASNAAAYAVATRTAASAADAAAANSARAAGKNRKAEQIRQGQFIVDYLKSSSSK